MAGAMRKMAVYLGLVEDDERYDDYDDLEQYDERDARDTARDDRRGRDHDDRRGGRDLDERDLRGARESREERTRTLSALREETRGSVATMPSRRPEPVAAPSPAPLDRITTIHPRTYNEAKTIGECFRGGTPVIMNLTEMDDADAKRLVDFAAGLVFGLHGTIERVTNKVFLLSPANVSVTAEDKARMAESGFFNQS
jgi:cell division inhibitor SepF